MGDIKVDVDVNDTIDSFLDEFEKKDNPEPEPIKEPEVDKVIEPEPEPDKDEPDPDDPGPEPEPDSTPEPEPTDAVEILEARNQKLLDLLEGRTEGAPKEIVPDDSIEPDLKVADKVVEPEAMEFIKAEQLEELLENPAKFNEVLNKVSAQAVERGEKQTVEKILRSIPQIVATQVSNRIAITRMVDKFYDDNKDLSHVKKTVGAVANEVHAENSDWAVEKVFKEAAVRTRKLLGLEEAALKKDDKKKDKEPNPAFVKSGARRERGGAQIEETGIAKEVSDLLEDWE